MNGFEHAVQEFGTKLQGADVGLFYYAGHGVQVRGDNYLVPVNANPTREADVDFQMLNAGLVLWQMKPAGTRLNLMILDACRNNPFGGAACERAAAALHKCRRQRGEQPLHQGASRHDEKSRPRHLPNHDALSQLGARPGVRQ
jgi:uncharacterized caspase-like protein